MALSNWDTLAINQDNDSVSGYMKTEDGVTAEIRKNHLIVEFGEERIVIENGNLSYHDLSISAVRGPQGGIYIACWERWEYKKFIVGCGVYGFDDSDWVGVKQESLDFLHKFITDQHPIWTQEEIDEMVASVPEEHREQMLEGMTGDKNVSYTLSKEIAAIDVYKGSRFNQGDAYFAQRAGADIPATKVGEAEEPILTQAFKEDKEAE